MLYINGRFLTQKVTGVQRFGIEVIKELDTKENADKVVVLTPPGVINEVNTKYIRIKCIGKKSNNFWTQVTFPLYVIKHKGVSLTMSGLCPVVKPDYFVCHDITFIRHPESFSRNFRICYELVYRLTLNRCKKIFTVSNFSKREISSVINVPESKFEVVGSASSNLIKEEFQIKDISKWGLDKNEYYLSVSSRNMHKNQKFILELADLNPDKTFVIVGGNNIKSFNGVDYEKKRNVVFTEYVDDDDLVSLYKSARGFIFPSLYEGFGLPPLEAIALGVQRVAVSDIPVFREVYDKDVYYFNPMKAEHFDFNEFEETSIMEKSRIEYLREHNWEKITKNIIDEINCSNG